MQYEKPIMSKPELQKLGFSEKLLTRAYRDRNQTFAQKISPGKTSTIIFDTKGFEEWRQRQIKAQLADVGRGG